MPFFYSISEGISMGVISYVVLNVVTGMRKRRRSASDVYSGSAVHPEIYFPVKYGKKNSRAFCPGFLFQQNILFLRLILHIRYIINRDKRLRILPVDIIAISF